MAYTTHNIRSLTRTWRLHSMGIVELGPGALVAIGTTDENQDNGYCYGSVDGGSTWSLVIPTFRPGSPQNWYMTPPMGFDGDHCYLFIGTREQVGSGRATYGFYYKITYSATPNPSFSTDYGSVAISSALNQNSFTYRVWAEAVSANTRVIMQNRFGLAQTPTMVANGHRAQDSLNGLRRQYIKQSGTSVGSSWAMLPYAWRHNGDGYTAVNSSSDGRIYFGIMDRPASGTPTVSGISLSGLGGSLTTIATMGGRTSLSQNISIEHIFGDGEYVWCVVGATSSSNKLSLIGIPYSLLSSGIIRRDVGAANEYTRVYNVSYWDGNVYILAGKSGSIDLLKVSVPDGTWSIAEAGIPEVYQKSVVLPRRGQITMFRVSSSGMKVLVRSTASAPERPTLLAPDPNSATRVSTVNNLTLDWTFTATDGTAQARVEIRRRVDGVVRYRRANSWAAGSSSVTQIPWTLSEYALSAAQWLDSGNPTEDHEFSVRVASAGATSLFSEWSEWGRVIPSTPRTLTVVSLGGVAYVDANTRIRVVTDRPELIWSVAPSINQSNVQSYLIRLFRYANDIPGSNFALVDTWLASEDIDPADSRFHHTQALDASLSGLVGFLEVDVTVDGVMSNRVRIEIQLDLPGADEPTVTFSEVDVRGQELVGPPPVDLFDDAGHPAGLKLTLEWTIPRDAGAPAGETYDYIVEVSVRRVDQSTGVVEFWGTDMVDAPTLPNSGALTQTHELIDWALRHKTDYSYIVNSRALTGRASSVEAS